MVWIWCIHGLKWPYVKKWCCPVKLNTGTKPVSIPIFNFLGVVRHSPIGFDHIQICKAAHIIRHHLVQWLSDLIGSRKCTLNKHTTFKPRPLQSCPLRPWVCLYKLNLNQTCLHCITFVAHLNSLECTHPATVCVWGKRVCTECFFLSVPAAWLYIMAVDNFGETYSVLMFCTYFFFFHPFIWLGL